MNTHIRQLPEVVRRWHNLSLGILPLNAKTKLPSLLKLAAHLAEELDQAHQHARRQARRRTSVGTNQSCRLLELSRELRELCLVFDWLHGCRSPSSTVPLRSTGAVGSQLPLVVGPPHPPRELARGGGSGTVYQDPLTYLEGRLLRLLLDRLANARQALQRESPEPSSPLTTNAIATLDPTLLDFPPPAPRK
jgi:hypothetical protein